MEARHSITTTSNDGHEKLLSWDKEELELSGNKEIEFNERYEIYRKGMEATFKRKNSKEDEKAWEDNL